MYLVKVGAAMRKFVETKEEALALYEQAKPVANAFDSWVMVTDLDADEIIKDSVIND